MSTQAVPQSAHPRFPQVIGSDRFQNTAFWRAHSVNNPFIIEHERNKHAWLNKPHIRGVTYLHHRPKPRFNKKEAVQKTRAFVCVEMWDVFIPHG